MQKVYQNTKHGPQIEAFMLHGVVSRKGKIAAVVSMSISYLLFQLLVKPDVTAGIGVAIILIIISLWLATRPEAPR